MSTIEFLTFLGTAVSLGLGVWNVLQTRRTQFINTVTSERVKWIQELRKNVSDLTGATHTWALMYRGTNTGNSIPEEKELLERIDRLRYLVRLQLNPAEQPDCEIETLIQRIPSHTDADLDSLLKALEELTAKTQILLKKEWEKVKKEAKAGAFPQEWENCHDRL